MEELELDDHLRVVKRQSPHIRTNSNSHGVLGQAAGEGMSLAPSPISVVPPHVAMQNSLLESVKRLNI
jgi:hypothetical protein